MQGVILAGGAGRRLRAEPGGRPKPLTEVRGRPLLAHVLDRLVTLGAREVVVVAGHRADDMVRAVGSQWHGRQLVWVRQPEPLGPAHALRCASDRLQGAFMMMHADVIFSPGVVLDPARDRFLAEAPDAVLLTERRSPERVGRGAVRVDPGGDVVDLREYPEPEEREWGRVAAGFYVCGPSVLSAASTVTPSREGEYELPDVFRSVLESGGRVLAVDLQGSRVNVNTPEDRQAAERLLAGD